MIDVGKRAPNLLLGTDWGMAGVRVWGGKVGRCRDISLTGVSAIGQLRYRQSIRGTPGGGSSAFATFITLLTLLGDTQLGAGPWVQGSVVKQPITSIRPDHRSLG
jgi:hypothetical protein